MNIINKENFLEYVESIKDKITRINITINHNNYAPQSAIILLWDYWTHRGDSDPSLTLSLYSCPFADLEDKEDLISKVKNINLVDNKTLIIDETDPFGSECIEIFNLEYCLTNNALDALFYCRTSKQLDEIDSKIMCILTDEEDIRNYTSAKTIYELKNLTNR